MTLAAKLLNATHKDYDREMLKQWRALFEGGKWWRELLDTWLPKFDQETDEAWSLRKSRALYENVAGPIGELLAGGLMTQPPIIQKFDKAWFPEFRLDVDNKGTDLESWFQARLMEAMQGGRSYAWVNLPDRNGQLFQSRADEEAAGALNAFLVPLRAIDVIDWETDGRGKLLWIMHRGKTTRRVSLGEKRRTVWTWTYIDSEVIRRWEWMSRDKDGMTLDEPEPHEEIDELETIEHRMGELPIIKLRLKPATHLMRKVRDNAVALLRAQIDLDHSLHRGAHALLWILSKWEPDKPVLGSGAFMQLRRDANGGGEDKIGYAAPPAEIFEPLARRITQLREAMFRSMHQMAVSADGNATRAQMSGESKQADWRATEIVLSAYADALRPFIADTLRLVSKVRDGETSMVRPTIDGLEGWHQEDLTEWMLAVAQATTVARLSETYHRAVARKQARRVLPYEDEQVMKAIEEEIDEADVSLETLVPDLDPPSPEDDV